MGSEYAGGGDGAQRILVPVSGPTPPPETPAETPAGTRPRGAAESPASTSLAEAERDALQQLRGLLDAQPRLGGAPTDVRALPRLHRLACSTLARLEAQGARPRIRDEVRRLVDRSGVALYRERDRVRGAGQRGLLGWIAATADALLVRGPRAVRAEWRLLLGSFTAFYGLALAAWYAVTQDLDLAYSLLDPAMVETEIAQLEATAAGKPFVGNFSFGLGESPSIAAWIMVHNMGVGVLFFAAALVPPLYLVLLLTNALMVGTYTAVAGHWDQAGAISSILWCHGTLELQALILAATSGLVLVRALLFPGAWTRRTALSRAARRAIDLLLPMFAMLFAAGLIEGFISPHAPLGVRLAVAISSGVLLVVWAVFGGRAPQPEG